MLANKCDLKWHRKVEKTKCEALADETGLHLVETSAKENVRVDEAFRHIVRQVLRVHPAFEKDRVSEAEARRVEEDAKDKAKDREGKKSCLVM